MQPKNFKYEKLHKKKIQKFKYKTFFLKFGFFALRSTKSGIISSYQFKAVKQILLKNFKKQGKIWFNIFPNIPITAKPIDVRMGKGKGSIKHWSFFVPSGFLLLEIFSNLNKMTILAFLKKGQKRGI